MALRGPDRKARVQGKIARLTEAQQQQIMAWMNQGNDRRGKVLIYTEIRKLIREKFGVSISQSSLSHYYSKHQREILDSQTSGGGTEPLHVTLVLHLQILPVLQPSANSDGK